MKGEVLGHYQIQEKIGSGGMGEVYRATDDRLGREVAIKVLQPGLADDPDRLRRFELEARAAAALNHPNILAVYDMGMHDGAPYIVSELLHGKTLRMRVQEGAIPLHRAADYAQQLAQGLVAAHDKGIIHRDLKPENIFITQDERVKILDFGIAKLIQPDVDDRSVTTMTTQTRTGSVMGTLAYMSPEQLRGKTVDLRSDIFSFGAIFLEMLTGKRAFSGETNADTMTAVLKDEPKGFADDSISPHPAFAGIVRHCLEKDPANRFQTARDLAFALNEAELYSGVRGLQFQRAKSHVRKWAPWILGATLLAAAGIFIGVAVRSDVEPAYQRLTFGRGTVYSARFTADGRSVLYGAGWNGHPLEIFSTAPNSVLSNPVSLSGHLLALSRSDQLAVVLGGVPGSRLDFEDGTLAQAPIAGGSPRELLQGVTWADWSSVGDLAVVRRVSGHDRLEYPIGKVLYETVGNIGNVRFSPDGRLIAYLDHPLRYDEAGSVCITDLSGNRSQLSGGWTSVTGLAWHPHGNEIWFTAAEHGATERALRAVTLSGKARRILSIPGSFTLQDIASDGRVLVASESERVPMEWVAKVNGGVSYQDLSWFDWTVAKDISPDGRSVLFQESGDATVTTDAVSLRRVDGTPPIKLGDGIAYNFSPDGKWALSTLANPPRIGLLPIGTGQPRFIPLPLASLQPGANFMPDGQSVLVNGNEAGHSVRTYRVDITNGVSRPVTPEGLSAVMPSPDGKYLAGVDREYKLNVIPVDGGPPRVITRLGPGVDTMAWTRDGKGIYIYRYGEIPLQVKRLDFATGRSIPVQQLAPGDRAGVVSIGPVVVNRDGTQFAYSYYQVVSVLYVVSGLR
jgi:Tol biopolymer transport system component